MARPKSVIFSRPSGVTRMFEGFRSRWMIPLVVGRVQRTRQDRNPARGPSRGRSRALQPSSEVAALDRARGRRTAGRPARPRRKSGRCWGAGAGRRPRPRPGSVNAGSSLAWLPARIILSATWRLRPHVPGLVDDAHAAPADLAEDLVAGHGWARGRPVRPLARQGRAVGREAVGGLEQEPRLQGAMDLEQGGETVGQRRGIVPRNRPGRGLLRRASRSRTSP